MTGFLDSLAARVRPDRSTVRPRPDALLLAQLQPGIRAAPAPIADDEVPADPPPTPRRRSAPAPPLPDAVAPTPPASRPAATSPPPSRPVDHVDVGQSGPAPSPPPVSEHATQRATAPTPPVPAPPRTAAGTEPAPTAPRQTRPAEAPADQPQLRALTTRPTADPATRAPTLPGPAAEPPPISILARANDSGADAGARRNDTDDAPPVEITIDRIDVRLASAGPPPRPPRTGPREPMSLARYLELREQPTNGRAP